MKPGFNLECAANNRARWGFCANCPSQRCHEEGEDADAAVGIGLTGQSSDPVGAGWTSYFASGGGTCEASSTTHRDVWLWVENMNITDGGVWLNPHDPGWKPTGFSAWKPGHKQKHMDGSHCLSQTLPM